MELSAMQTVCSATTGNPLAVSEAYFEQRLAQLEPLLRLRFVPCVEADQLADLLQEARVYLWQACRDEPEIMQRSNDNYWCDLALRGVLRLNECQSYFEQQYLTVERRLRHWARRQFKPDVVEDVVQGAFIELRQDYERHQQTWDEKSEAFWVVCGKLAMRSASRALMGQDHRRKGSTRRGEKETWVQQVFTESQLPTSADENGEDDPNDLLDRLSQTDDVDWHGNEVRLANLR